MRFWYYVMRASWRHAFGRWYVWRDVPTDIVRQVAVLWFFARRKDYADDERSLIHEAHREYALRKLKEKNI